jgi:hypothetical protein
VHNINGLLKEGKGENIKIIHKWEKVSAFSQFNPNTWIPNEGRELMLSPQYI